MSERHDMRIELDERVHQAYRALPDEDVPVEVDAKVIQAASAALNQKRKPGWLKWSAPVALAASMLVVVAIVLEPGAHKTIAPTASGALQKVYSLQSSPTEPSATSPPPPPPAAMVEQEAKRAGEAKEKAEAAARARQRAENAEDIMVTARRREERLQDVPMSITVLPDVAMPEVPAPAVAGLGSDAPGASAPEAEMDAKAEGDLAGAEVARADADKRIQQFSAAPANAPSQPQRETPSAQEAVVPAARPSTPELSEIAVTARRTESSKLDARLHRILELQSEGRGRRAANEIELLQKEYPNVDVQAALRAMREAEKDSN